MPLTRAEQIAWVVGYRFLESFLVGGCPTAIVNSVGTVLAGVVLKVIRCSTLTLREGMWAAVLVGSINGLCVGTIQMASCRLRKNVNFSKEVGTVKFRLTWETAQSILIFSCNFFGSLFATRSLLAWRGMVLPWSYIIPLQIPLALGGLTIASIHEEERRES